MKKLSSYLHFGLFLFSCADVHAAATTAVTADAFIDSMGVNLSLPNKDSAYGDVAQVVQDLNYLGIHHIRDGIASPQDYVTLANAGIKFSLLGGQMAADGSCVDMALVDAIANRVGPSIIAIEGPNEVDNWPVGPYKGIPVGDQAAIAFMHDLYVAVKANPHLAPGTIVYDMTGPVYSLAGRADVANSHPYPSHGQQPYTFIQNAFNHYLMPAPFPKVITEIGYFNLPPSWPQGKPWEEASAFLGIDEATQAKGILNIYFDAALFGVSRTYVYELLDPFSDPNSTDWQQHFGLFRFTHEPKPSAVAIHNLTTILRNNDGSQVKNSAPGRLDFSFESMPSTGSSLLLQRSDGTFLLALWNNVDFWASDWTTSVPVNSTPVKVMLHLQQQASSIQVFDPLVGTKPLSSNQNLQGLLLNVPDHPILVAITLASSSSN